MNDTKIAPCPMPGCEGECWDVVAPAPVMGAGRRYAVKCLKCNYCSSEQETKEQAIAVHNELCRKLELADRAQKAIDNPPQLRDVEYDIEGRDRRVGSYAEAAMVMQKLFLDMLTCADARTEPRSEGSEE